MDALKSLGIDWKLLIAQIVNFVILLLILRKFLFAPIVNLLENRHRTIARGLTDAEEAEKKLQLADIEARKKVSEAINEAEKITKEARRNAEAENQKTLKLTQEKALKIVASAHDAAKQEEGKIVSSAKSHVAQLVIAGVEKILGEKQEEIR